MKFGKLTDIEEVDFNLPPSHTINKSILEHNPQQSSPTNIYVGCTGWSMKEWAGNAYPEKSKPKEYLKYYGEQFNTIELNTTHYRIPDRSTIAKWYEETPSDFRFCPKLPQSISHSRNLGLDGSLIPSFCEAVQGLEDKLGCCFMQLPPYFGVERFDTLAQFAKAFPKHIPLAIEVRHENWFNNDKHLNILLGLLVDYGLSIVITDVAGRRDVLHMAITNTICMIRFVGNGLHSTDYRRADQWVEKLKQWHGSGLHEVYLFPHQPDNQLAPQMAAYFTEQIQEKIPASNIRGPVLPYPPEEGDQMSLF